MNQSVYAAREASDNRKFKHSWRVLKDWATLAGVELNFPSQYHPAKSVHAMRMACTLVDDQPKLAAFTNAAFESYFGRQENLDDPDVLVAVANSVGLDGGAMRERSQSDEVKALLRSNTEEVIERGGYGSPTIFVGQDAHVFRQRPVAAGGFCPSPAPFALSLSKGIYSFKGLRQAQPERSVL